MDDNNKSDKQQRQQQMNGCSGSNTNSDSENNAVSAPCSSESLNLEHHHEQKAPPVEPAELIELSVAAAASTTTTTTTINKASGDDVTAAAAAALSRNIIVHEPTLPSDTWLLGGTLGSRNACLVFKSSALANTNHLTIQTKPGYKLHITYKVLQAETKLLAKLLDCHGVTEVATNSSDFNLLWTGSHPRPGILRSLASHQRVNHFPRSYELTRKDRLYKNIERMQHAKGYKRFDFIPQTFVMPMEYNELCSTHHRIKGPWIVKPVASSRGRGIFIVETPNQVPCEEPVVVAKYISKPLLVAGHKCDLRLYIAVTSFDPLLVYIYEEGLVRFATVKYDSSHKQLWNPCMHLCNYSINKYHSDYVKSDDPSAENVGHKWTLSALLRHLKSEKKDTALLMSQIEDLVVKAILASANSIISACRMFVPNPNNCFELYGFDILIDANLKPWLLEVNLSPSLGCDSPLDVRLKSAMLADLLTLVGIPAIDPILRPSSINLTSTTTITKNTSSNNLKMKLNNCRRVHSIDGSGFGNSNTLPRRQNSSSGSSSSSASSSTTTSSNNSRLTSTTTSTLNLTVDESKVLRMAKGQFERRGGFVRIFPAIDSWSKYSQYLDSLSGIPISGNTNIQSVYNLTSTHNYNLLLYTQLFPDIPISTTNKLYERTRYNNSLDRKHPHHQQQQLVAGTIDSTSSSSNSGVMDDDDGSRGSTPIIIPRQDRYERMLSQGHRQALLPQKIVRGDEMHHQNELRKQVIESLKNGKQLAQCDIRKTFSHYLAQVLKRISSYSSDPDQENHVEIVLKFLQKASNYLRTPYFVKTPSRILDGKDRVAIIAKQLNDFLYLYNRETDLFVVDKTAQSDQLSVADDDVPVELYSEFLENARECDLEEILIHQTTPSVPTHEIKSGFQGILKHIPNAPPVKLTSGASTTKPIQKKSSLSPPHHKSAVVHQRKIKQQMNVSTIS